MKSINKAILGMVSESFGCNESVRTGDPKKQAPKAELRRISQLRRSILPSLYGYHPNGIAARYN